MGAEQDLLSALRAGDTDALASLFEAYADRLFRLADRLLGDPSEAEDVVQETFLKAITHLDRFEGRSQVGTWLYRVAYNASMDRLRARRDLPLPPDEPESEDGQGLSMPQIFLDWDTPEKLVASAEDLAVLEAAIQGLSDNLRAVFVLRDIERLTTEKTADVLQITPGAVKVRLHRARLALRERLAESFAERQAGKVGERWNAKS